MSLKISIIIPVYNHLQHTQQSLKEIYDRLSLIEDNLKPFVIVVDDGSSDGTASWIKANYPQTIVLTGDGNLWWSGAINEGSIYALEVLDTDYILWWNNDITMSKDYMVKLYDIIKAKKIDIGGSKIYYANSSRIWSMGGKFDTRSGRKYMTGMDEMDKPEYGEITSADWLPGMGTFIHKSVFSKIGFVDSSNFPQYHGDSDFTFRATLSGYRIKVYPELKIWNDKSNSGIAHNNNYRQLFKTLNDNRSNYHLAKDLAFYKRYSTSALAYRTLLYKYCYYVGGFLKWKVLNTLGVTKRESI